jgi:hypothetical protein
VFVIIPFSRFGNWDSDVKWKMILRCEMCPSPHLSPNCFICACFITLNVLSINCKWQINISFIYTHFVLMKWLWLLSLKKLLIALTL